MNRVILLAGGAMALTAAAADLAPTQYENVILRAISRNGEWVAGSDDQDICNIIRLSDSKRWDYGTGQIEQTVYSLGLGQCISDNGIVVGSEYSADKPMYWQDGNWEELPLTFGDFGAYPNAITADGNMIVGSVSKAALSVDNDFTSVVPCIWTRTSGADTYHLYQALPYPRTDWTGRTPQMVTLLDVTADGSMIIGEMRDYQGFAMQPVVYTKQSNGTWTYRLIHPELLNPEGVTFPPNPGEEPPMPDPADYMTSEQKAAYQAALDAYQNRVLPEAEQYMSTNELMAYYDAIDAYYAGKRPTMPQPEEFMTEEEIADFNNDLDAYYNTPYPNEMNFMSPDMYYEYQDAYNLWLARAAEWLPLWEAFEAVMDEIRSNPETVSFSMNSSRISPEGKFSIMTADEFYPDPDPSSELGFITVKVPYLFDLENDTYCRMNGGIGDVYATQVTDEGWILGGSPASLYTRDGVIAKGADEPFVELTDEILPLNKDLYDWIFDYMHSGLTGTPVADSKLSIYVTWNWNSWDFSPSAADYYSYVLPLSYDANGIETPEVAPAADTDAVLYDLHGVRVPTDRPLTPGIYLQRTGTKTVKVLVR